MRKFEKLYLHVGLEKTGTTSIQKSMHKHRDQLKALGYYYPKQFAVGLNTTLAAMFHRDPMSRENFRHIINKRGGTQQSHIATMKEELAEELSHVSTEKLVLSSEFLGSQSDLEKLKVFCQSLAKETEVIIYLREQCSFVLSLHSTYLKGGGYQNPMLGEISKNKLPASLNFESVIGQLEKVFPENLTVRLFDRKFLFQGDAVQDFYKVIGLEDHASGLAMPRENESLSQVGAEFLRRFNPSIPISRGGQKNVARDRLIQDIGGLDSTGIFGKESLTPEQAKKLRNVFKSGNEWVRAKYFPERKNLFPPFKPADPTSVSEEDISTYAAHLLEKAYLDLNAKQVLLNEIAPVLNHLSKHDDLKEDAQNLRQLNKKIIQNRKL